ncbi:hypothetical protein OAL24_00571 [Oenococcus sicerae]|uniref:Uncharacterized protein n=1 Tax=Oenococcus sicerae TaxID=2203724 RepID=A0AAJ1RD76_9LACO|nr:hypothetical protein [Oenococcus sicerae]VDK13773.1 hypothetical protein OAL24_00571 [Oenococcus sicerae]
MKRLYCWQSISRKKNSYVLLTTIILIFLFTGLSLGLALIHANQITALQNITHCYGNKNDQLVENDENP